MLLSVGKPNDKDTKRSKDTMSLLHLFILGTALWIASVGFTEYMQNHIFEQPELQTPFPCRSLRLL